MQEQVQIQGSQHRKVEAARAANEAAQTAAQSKDESLTAWESVLRGEFGQLSRHVGQVGD